MLATNKKQFEMHFRQDILPEIRKVERRHTQESEQTNKRFIIDYPMRREEWNNYIDSLVKDGELPERAMDWTCPW